MSSLNAVNPGPLTADSLLDWLSAFWQGTGSVPFDASLIAWLSQASGSPHPNPDAATISLPDAAVSQVEAGADVAQIAHLTADDMAVGGLGALPDRFSFAHSGDADVLVFPQDTSTPTEATPELPVAAGLNPAFDLIGLSQLRRDPRYTGLDGSGLSVAVIDSGIDWSHPLLQPNYLAGVDFVTGSPNPTDWLGHGTHVSGIIGAQREDIGVAPAVGLLGLQVFEADANGAVSAPNPVIEDALEWVLANRAQYNIVAVNLALGSGFYTSGANTYSILEDDIDRLEAAGVTVVASGGNDFKRYEYPSFNAPAVFSTLAVGSVWQDGSQANLNWGSGASDYTTGSDRIVSHSQRLQGPNTLFAPGAMITSTALGGGLEPRGGTSMAASVVTGAVALLQEAALQFGGRLLSPAEITELLISTADTIFDGDDEDDNVQNTLVPYPRINVFNAVAELERRFTSLAPALPSDANSTLVEAIVGPRLEGLPVSPVLESIGIDAGGIQVGDADIDLIRFDVVSAGEVIIEVTPHAIEPADFDSLLRLFDANGSEIAMDDDNGQGTFSRLAQFLAPGTYYAGVSGYGNGTYDPGITASGTPGATGNYALTFDLITGDPTGTLSGAVKMAFEAPDPFIFVGHIGTDDSVNVGGADVDLFKVVMPGSGQLFLDIDTPYKSNYLDSYLRLFDAEGNPLFFEHGQPFASDDDLAFNAAGEFTEFVDDTYSELIFEDPLNRQYFSGHKTDSFLGVLGEAGDVFYVGVSDYFNQNYDPKTLENLENRVAIGSGGNYVLTAQFVNTIL